MEFSPEEKQKLKAMLLFLIKRKHKDSGGTGGFLPNELKPILEEMVDDGAIEKHETINNQMYFLIKNQ